MFQSLSRNNNLAPTLGAMVLALTTFGCSKSADLSLDPPKPQTDEYVSVIRNSKIHLITSTSEPSEFGYDSLSYDPAIGQLIGTTKDGSFIIDINKGTPAHETGYTRFISSGGVLYGRVGQSCFCNQYESVKLLPGSTLSNSINVASEVLSN